jgi:chaperone BCS1
MYIKTLIPVIWNFVLRKISYTAIIENKTELYKLFNKWLDENHSDKFKRVLAKTETVYKAKSNNFKYTQDNHNSFFYFWYKKRLIFVSSSREKFESSASTENMHMDSYIVTSFFSKGIVKELFKELIETKNEEIKNNDRIYLYDFDVMGYWAIVNSINSKSYDKIFNDEKKILYNDIENFLANKKYYGERGIPYKRGYLLHGKPGNGKSTTILALAKKFNKDVYNLNISTIGNDNALKKAFRGIASNSFILIEDVDASLKNRDDINQVSFNTLLNLLDGALSKENVCVFFTTNHIEQLDSALLRCGRVDVKVEFDNPTKDNLIEMLKLFYSTEEVPEFKYKGNLSACELQETCIELPTIEEAINYFKKY